MNNFYTNGYNVAIDQDEKEVVINFVLTTPQINHDDDGKIIVKAETVATVIMRKEMAEELAKNIIDSAEKKDEAQ